MILTLLCSIALIFASIAASTTSTPRSKNFDELLDTFMVVEKNRKTVIKMAEDEAAKAKSNVTLNFLKVVREADKVFENIQRYFDAGKVMFDTYKGKLKLNETDLEAKTEPLRQDTNLNDPLIKLSATCKTIEAQLPDLPKGLRRTLRTVIECIKQSEQALTLLGKKFRDDLEQLEQISI